MENMNKNNKQYKDAALGAFIGWIGILLSCLIIVLFTGCYGTYYITDAEYDNVREEHLAVTYHNNSIYWGWNSGYYYYYGKPHYYPWYYYYNTCPPSYYNVTTHIIINKPVNKPTHRPNRPIYRPNNKGNVIIKTNTHRNTKVKTNINRNKVIIKNNRSNNSNKRSVNTRKRLR
jgi:hypothetical protein